MQPFGNKQHLSPVTLFACEKFLSDIFPCLFVFPSYLIWSMLQFFVKDYTNWKAVSEFICLLQQYFLLYLCPRCQTLSHWIFCKQHSKAAVYRGPAPRVWPSSVLFRCGLSEPHALTYLAGHTLLSALTQLKKTPTCTDESGVLNTRLWLLKLLCMALLYISIGDWPFMPFSNIKTHYFNWILLVSCLNVI